MVKKKFKVIVHHLPKRQFEKHFKEYGKHTAALADPVHKKSDIAEIYIKKGSSPKQFKKVVQHEVGHAIIDKTEMCKKFSKPEQKKIRAYARYQYGPHRKKVMHLESPREQLMEGLAWIYQKGKSGTLLEKKQVKTDFKKAYEEFKKAKKRLNMKVVKKVYGLVK